MNQKSKYFDSIRVKPEQDRLKTKTDPTCEVNGCVQPGIHRAPKGRGQEGKYHQFCMAHVRQYNKSFNYFKDMPDDDIANYQKSARTGHRPTWSLGTNSGAVDPSASGRDNPRFSDSFGFFGEKTEGGPGAKPRKRQIRNAERRSLATLGLDIDVKPKEVKAQFKMLVKRHHPDANGGGQEFVEKLREIIQAYDYLKSSGFC